MEIKDIIDGIAIKLNEKFGYTMYVDEVPQGFKTPSFCIHMVSMIHDRELGNDISGRRWLVAPLFDIQFFSDKGRSDLFQHSLQVQQALQQIKLVNDDILLSVDQNTTIEDDIAHNFMQFNIYLYDKQRETFMDSLSLDTRIRRVT